MNTNKRILRSFLAMGALATACASWGCVADRPARNGVYNENQYIRKDFLVRPGTTPSTDPGWIFRSTIVATSAPNPLGPLGLFVGADNSGGDASSVGVNYVRFDITSDKLNMVDMRELSSGFPAQGSRDSEVVNAWPITNVDLKYRVNLDGETTNFYEENQELDWQVRQWVKLNLDKNDMSDLAPLGVGAQSVLTQCTDAANISTTLVPGSFNVDEANNYITWQVQLSAPVIFTTPACADAYGAVGVNFLSFGRTDVTLTLMYSLVRAAPDSGIWTPERAVSAGSLDVSPSTYVPFVVAEKDPIRRKYGVFETIVWDRDPNTGLLAAQEFLNRYNPNAPFMDWYLAEGYPAEFVSMWTTPGGIVDQTNQLFIDAKATTRMRVFQYNDDTSGAFGNGTGPARQFGDVRYNFVHWVSDLDVADGPGFAGFTPSLNDPRTGERISTVINIADFPLYDYYVTRFDYYLQTIGAEQQLDATGNWPVINSACYVGQTYPFGGLDLSVGGVVQTQHNEISTVYDKMQLYLHKPSTTYGYLNPSDFIPQESQDFFNAFNRIMPYEVFRDPASNPFVIPEGGAGYYAPSQMDMDAYAERAQFHALMGAIDRGESPYEADPTVGYAPNFLPQGVAYDGTGGASDFQAAQAFTDNMKQLNTDVFNQQYRAQYSRYGQIMDGTEILDNFTVFEKDARHCVWNNPQHTTGPTPACAGGGSGTTHWECRSEYLTSLVQSYWTQTVWHEFGHAVGLRHNFMSSLDRNNFPTWTDTQYASCASTDTACQASHTHIGLYASSLMEYNSTPDRLFFAGGAAQDNGNGGTGNVDNKWATTWNGKPGWAPYDMGAVSFIYGNNQSKTALGPYGTPNVNVSVSGQGNDQASAPWHDPHGYNATTHQEIQYLFCTDEHLQYSPFCRQGDFGTTPSEIIAAAIDSYEWNYKWRNFRLYRKFWNDAPYADGINSFFLDSKRFLSSWAYDWNGGELITNFKLLNIPIPAGVPSINYYSDLNNAFTNDISVANQLVAAFHKAIIQQSSGERPYITVYDQFSADVVQQGIIIDKLLALQNWTALYQISNYDPNQAAGAYLFAATPFDSNYQSVAEDTLLSMIGGQYDIFQYVSPLSVQMFAQASHDINFTGRIESRDWVGGKAFGGPEIDPNRPFLDYFHNLAAVNNAEADTDPVIFKNCSESTPDELDACAWDPRTPQLNANDIYHSDPYNEFRGPDNRRYAWASIADRNQIVVVDRDRNTASYITIRNYNQDVVTSQDDGSQGAYYLELPIKYTIDSFDAYN